MSADTRPRAAAETTNREAASTALLAALDASHQRLVDLLADVFFAIGEWPTFHHVEAILDQDGPDAGELLASFPRIGGSITGTALFSGPLAASDRRRRP